MKNQLISFKTASLAKEKDVLVMADVVYDSKYPDNKAELDRGVPYDRVINAPTQTALQKELREKHKIHINLYVNSDNEGDEPIKWSYSYTSRFDNALHDDAFNCCNDKVFNTYEEALEEGLFQTLELI